MIDYLSLAIGHGLLAVVLFRLVLSEELDTDPRIQEYVDKTEAERESARRSGRNATRREAAEAALKAQSETQSAAQSLASERDA